MPFYTVEIPEEIADALKKEGYFVKPKREERSYILWDPAGETNPRKRIRKHGIALAIANMHSLKHGRPVFVAKLIARVTSKGIVEKEFKDV